MTAAEKLKLIEQILFDVAAMDNAYNHSNLFLSDDIIKYIQKEVNDPNFCVGLKQVRPHEVFIK